MKFPLLLVLLSANITWQHNVFWSPASWISHYFYGYPAIDYSQTDQSYSLDRIETRGKSPSPSSDVDAEGRLLGFKVLGLEALGNALVNSYRASSTSTTIITTTSYLTVATTVQCITRTSFVSVTPCKRRRRHVLSPIIADKSIHPTEVKTIVPTDAATFRASRTVENKVEEIHSSKEKQDKPESPMHLSEPYIDNYTRGGRNLVTGTIYVSTLTATTYSIYTQTSTYRIAVVPAGSSVFCLPSGIVIC